MVKPVRVFLVPPKALIFNMSASICLTILKEVYLDHKHFVKQFQLKCERNHALSRLLFQTINKDFCQKNVKLITKNNKIMTIMIF